MTDLVLENGMVFYKNKLVQANISIKNGLIEKISKKKTAARQKIDCSGKIIIPGLIDAHVHFRVPGEEQKEDWIKGSKAALAGGITTVLDMPNNIPLTSTVEALEEKRKTIANETLVNYGFHFGAVNGNENEVMNSKNIASIKLFTTLSTGNMFVQEKNEIERFFRIASQKKIIVCVHAEEHQIIEKNTKRLKKFSDPLIHSKVRSVQAETTAIEALLEIQRKTKNKLYFCHVSSAEGIKIISEEKQKNPKIFCEVTPHHLFLNEKSLEKHRNFCKVNPSLKTEKDRLALWKAIKENIVDVIASDHAPHSVHEKKQPYWNAPSGMPGTQTMIPLLLDAASKKKISIETIAQLCSCNPAKIFGIKSKGMIEKDFDADLTIIDAEKTQTIFNKNMHSKSSWTVFHGQKTTGIIEQTVLGGKIVFDKGEFFTQNSNAKEVVFQ